LPNKGDPFPPMLQRRDPKTGRSTTEEIDNAAIAAMLGSLAPLPSSMAARELPSDMRGEQAKEGELHDWESSFEGSIHDSAQDIPAAAAVASSVAPSGEDIAENRAVAGLQAGAREAKPSLQSKWLFVVAGVAVVGVAAAGYFVLGGQDQAPEEAKAAATKKADLQPAKAAPDVPDGAGAKQGADTPDAADEKQGADAATDAKQEADTEAGVASAEKPSPADSTAADSKEPAPADEPAFDTGKLTGLPLRFAQGSARYEVTDADALGAAVDTFRTALERDPNARLEIGGHASSEGSAIANRVLGRRRAVSVRTHLVSQGISASRIVVRSYGAETPAVDPANPGALEKNRRVTLKLID